MLLPTKALNQLSTVALNVFKNGIDNAYLLTDVKELSKLIESLKNETIKLEKAVHLAQATIDFVEAAKLWRDEVLVCMNTVRAVVDAIEVRVDSKDWPMPTYIDLLFGIK